MRLHFSLFIILFFIFCHESLAADNVMQDYIVAKVNKDVVTDRELKNRIKFFYLMAGLKLEPNQNDKVIKNAILSKIIEELLIKQDAKKIGLEISQIDLDNGAEIISLSQGYEVSKIKNILKKNNINFSIFLEQVSAEILWSKIIANKITPTISISNLEIKEMMKRADLIKEQKIFKISEISIINKDENSEVFINKLYDELILGGSFDEIARNFSQSYDIEKGAEIGWVDKIKINQNIYNIIANLRVGQFSKPVKIGNSYRIFKMLDIKYKENIKEEDLQRIESYITQNKIKLKSKAYLLKLKRDAFIEILM